MVNPRATKQSKEDFFLFVFCRVAVFGNVFGSIRIGFIDFLKQTASMLVSKTPEEMFVGLFCLV